MRVDPNYTTNLANAVNDSALSIQTLTQQLSSGLRVSSLSDDPEAVAQSALLSTQLDRIDSFVSSSSTEQSLLQVSDSTLGEVVTQITSAISVATRAATGTQNTSNLAASALQVASLRDEVLSLANTSYLGQHIFGGSQGSVAPYTLDTSTDPATLTYHGDSTTQSIVTPSGQSVQVNLPGSAVFTSALTTLNQLVSDLNAGNSAAVSTDTAALNTALTDVTQQRSVLDNSLSQLTSVTTYAQTLAATLTATQTSLVASDPTTIATGLQAAETQHQALLSVIASMRQNNLFDLLQ
jgi:flagellar hook-associated protein 3 FlgL